ncbi:MAG: hypothetical protein RLP44_31055 [Aggregatilineales bacterium]
MGIEGDEGDSDIIINTSNYDRYDWYFRILIIRHNRRDKMRELVGSSQLLVFSYPPYGISLRHDDDFDDFTTQVTHHVDRLADVLQWKHMRHKLFAINVSMTCPSRINCNAVGK